MPPAGPVLPALPDGYPGSFRVVRVLDDPAGALLEVAQCGLAEAAMYPDTVDRRDERCRGAGE